MTVTLADLAAKISQRSRVVNDTDYFAFEANGITAEPRTNEDLRNFLHALAAINQMTILVDVKSEVKVFSEFRMEEVCALDMTPRIHLVGFRSLNAKMNTSMISPSHILYKN